MFNKRIKVLAILFSLLLMIGLGFAIISNELGIYRAKQARLGGLVQDSKSDSQMYLNWGEICSLRSSILFSPQKILNDLVEKVKYEGNVYRWAGGDDRISYIDACDLVANPHLVNRIYNKEFIPANLKETISFYQESMLALAVFFPGFQPWRYLVKLLLILIISGIPYLLALLSSLFALNFPIAAPVLAAFLLFFTMLKGYAQDTTIVKFNTSTTGASHNLSLAMFHMGKGSGGLVMLADKGIRGAYGPLWKFSKGTVLFPVGVVCGKGEDGARVEYLSLWSILMLKFGNLNHILLGAYNQPVIKNLFPNAFAKQVVSYQFSRIRLGLRADYVFQKPDKWKNLITFGPMFEFVKKNFTIHLHATLGKPHTIKTEWQVAF